jgi:hypothetical protein
MQVGRLVVIVLVGLLAAGCGGGDDDSSPDTSRPPADVSSSTAPPTTRSAESEVEEAYLAYWAMTVRLQQAPDPDDPEIRVRAVGQAADALTDGLTTLRARNHVVHVGDRYAHEVISVEFDDRGAIVRDCFIDDAATVDSSTGERVSGGLVSGLLVAIVQEVEGNWRVSELEIQETHEGAGRCAGPS